MKTKKNKQNRLDNSFCKKNRFLSIGMTWKISVHKQNPFDIFLKKIKSNDLDTSIFKAPFSISYLLLYTRYIYINPVIG